ncbi:hypothetical protein T11_9613 [Trichinella zimbabwensis]|uniref:Uncharacterized protein n=1 Tax=Trichinella zimbabwensis TaxID=268475 RepID=A0A0V1GHK1_9BILA|nr:hypothetical protein T11_9613 [Trichinella zimbabwensis]
MDAMQSVIYGSPRKAAGLSYPNRVRKSVTRRTPARQLFSHSS